MDHITRYTIANSLVESALKTINANSSSPNRPNGPEFLIRENHQYVVKDFLPTTDHQIWLINFLKSSEDRNKQLREDITFRLAKIGEEMEDKLQVRGISQRVDLTILHATAIGLINNASSDKAADNMELRQQRRSLNAVKEILENKDVDAEAAVNIMLSILGALPTYKMTELKEGNIKPRYFHKEIYSLFDKATKTLPDNKVFADEIQYIVNQMKINRLDFSQQAIVMGTMIAISHADVSALKAVQAWTENYCKTQTDPQTADSAMRDHISYVLECGVHLARYIDDNTRDSAPERENVLLPHEAKILAKLHSFLETYENFSNDAQKKNNTITTSKQRIKDMLAEHNSLKKRRLFGS